MMLMMKDIEEDEIFVKDEKKNTQKYTREFVILKLLKKSKTHTRT